jgi:iron complex transport system substrate-binding protein
LQLKSFYEIKSIKIHCFIICYFLLLDEKKNEISSTETRTVKNEIHYAKGFESIVIRVFNSKITAPWPGAKENFTYILQENGIIPDSIKQFTTIQIPIKSIIVTSTTHVPALEMLGVENTLCWFPEYRLYFI